MNGFYNSLQFLVPDGDELSDFIASPHAAFKLAHTHKVNHKPTHGLYNSHHFSIPLPANSGMNSSSVTISENDLSFFDILTTDSACQFYRSAAITLAVVLFLFPLIGLIVHILILYAPLLLIYCYQRIKQLLLGSELKINVEEARKALFWWWRFVLKVMYDHEYVFIGGKPKNPVLYVGMHAFFPVDALFIWSCWSQLFPDRDIIVTASKRSIQYPQGIKGTMFEIMYCYGWSRDELINFMKSGRDIFAVPGGASETIWNNEYYKLYWNNRVGFARVALEAKCSVVPAFTRNIQEAFRKPWYFEAFLQRKINFSQILPSILNGIPVKLTTYFGPEIPFDGSLTSEQLAEKTKDALENLISDHQPIPGSKLRAFLERFRSKNNNPKYGDVKDHDTIKPLISAV